MKRLSVLFVTGLICTTNITLAQFADDVRRNVAKEKKMVAFASPDVAGIATNHSKGIDFYTGRFNTSIPLGGLSSRSLSVNLTIGYVSGFKVDQVSGWTGNNWSLQTGVISRQMVGLPDEVNVVLPYGSFWISGKTKASGYWKAGSILDQASEIDWNTPSIYAERQDGGKIPTIRRGDMDPGKYTEHLDEPVSDLSPDIFTMYLPSCKGGAGTNIEFLFKSIPRPNGESTVTLVPTTQDHHITIDPILQQVEISHTHQALPQLTIIGFKVRTAEGCEYTFGSARPVYSESQIPNSVQISQRMSSSGGAEHEQLSSGGGVNSSSYFLSRDVFAYSDHVTYDRNAKGLVSNGVDAHTRDALYATTSKDVSTLYTSAWYLSKIEDMHGQDSIVFSYDKVVNFTRLQQSTNTTVTFPNLSHKLTDGKWKKRWPSISEAGGDVEIRWLPHPARTSVNFNVVYLDYQKVKLRKIKAANGARIELVSITQNPEVINETLLDEIRFFDIQNNATRALRFAYQIKRPTKYLDKKLFWMAGTSIYYSEWFFGNHEWTEEYVFDEMVKARQTRVFLSKIEQKGTGQEFLPPFEFSYYESENGIPGRFSEKQDAWGYANGNNNAVGIPMVPYYFDALENVVRFDQSGKTLMFNNWGIAGQENTPLGGGADKRPSMAKALAGNLKTMRLPESGLFEIRYEQNTKADGTPVGGLRVKELLSYPMWPSELGKTVERFSYEGGKVYNDPVFYSQSRQIRFYQPVTVSDNSMRPAYTTKGGEVGYAKVTIRNVNGNQTLGKTVHYFSVPDDAPPLGISGLNDGLPPIIHDDSRQGLLQKTEVYSHSDQLLAKTEYGYNSPVVVDEVRSLTSMVFIDPIFQGEANNPHDQWQRPPDDVSDIPATLFNEPAFLFSYKLTPTRIVNQPLQTQVTHTQWGTDSSSPVVTQTSTTYTSKDQTKISSMIDSDGKELKTESVYAYEFSGNAALNDLAQQLKIDGGVVNYMNANKFWPLLMTIVTRKVNNEENIVVGASINYYSMSPDGKGIRFDSTGMVSLTADQDFGKSVYNRIADAVETVSIIHRYDQYDHILTHSVKDNIKQSYLWGYNNTLPIAEATNADDTEIFYQSFEDSDDPMVKTNASEAKAGERYYEGSSLTLPFVMPNQREYRVSYWYFKDNKWNLNVKPFTSLISHSGASRYDEIKVHPKDALMTTYTHLPGVGIRTINDPNNIIKYFEYDEYNRLKVIRDQDFNILSLNKYELRKQPNE